LGVELEVDGYGGRDVGLGARTVGAESCKLDVDGRETSNQQPIAHQLFLQWH
jgi:hypothetical protein